MSDVQNILATVDVTALDFLRVKRLSDQIAARLTLAKQNFEDALAATKQTSLPLSGVRKLALDRAELVLDAEAVAEGRAPKPNRGGRPRKAAATASAPQVAQPPAESVGAPAPTVEPAVPPAAPEGSAGSAIGAEARAAEEPATASTRRRRRRQAGQPPANGETGVQAGDTQLAATGAHDSGVSETMSAEPGTAAAPLGGHESGAGGESPAQASGGSRDAEEVFDAATVDASAAPVIAAPGRESGKDDDLLDIPGFLRKVQPATAA